MIEAKEKVKGMLANVLSTVIPLIGSTNICIALAACKVLQRAADLVPDSIIDHPTGEMFLNMFCEGLKLSQPIVASSIFWIITNLSECYHSTNSQNVWNMNVEMVMTAVILACDRTDIPPNMFYFKDHAYTAILAIIQKCYNSEVQLKFLKHFVPKAKKEIEKGNDIFVISGLFSAISVKDQSNYSQLFTDWKAHWKLDGITKSLM